MTRMQIEIGTADNSKCYKSGTGREVHALRDISLQVNQGSCRGIVGESGCGKSTLCRLLAGIEPADSGEIRFKGEAIKEAVRGKRRHEIQMIFQNSLDASPLHFTAYRMIGEPLTNFTRARRSERTARVKELLRTVGISESELYKYPDQFSGGQLQRVCIARALAAEPELLLLDEPLSSLDVSVQAQILNLLSDLKKELKLTMILVSHDLEAVYYLSDAVTVMYGGYIMEEIDEIFLFEKLCHPYTLRLLSSSYGWQQAGWENHLLWDGCEAEQASRPRDGSEKGQEACSRDDCEAERGLCSRNAHETAQWLCLRDGSEKGQEACSRDDCETAQGMITAGCPYAVRCPFAWEKCMKELPPCRELEKGHRVWCHRIQTE